MCFDSDSSPPIPVISGAAISHDDLVLEAPDGNRFAAFAASPDEPATTGVVILPDVRGLYRFYEELALRFAERGYAAAAFDYFGRTAGVAKRGDDFEYMQHVQQTTPDGGQAAPQASSTRSSPTPARRTASSTASRTSSPTPRPTPGAVCSSSSTATRRRSTRYARSDDEASPFAASHSAAKRVLSILPLKT